jgi:hypothetical protein
MATWSDLKTEIKNEFDLNEETFITDTELLAYANDAVENIENALISTNQKYFHSTPHTISIVSGTQDYSMPTDIYANKIIGVFYNYNGTKYEIKPIKDYRKIMDIDTNDDYQYVIVNSTASGTKLRLYPTGKASESSAIYVYYVRNITRLTADADTLDVPEAKAFIKQYVIDKAFNKERMNPGAPMSDRCVQLREELLEALSTMIIDENNTVEVENSVFDEIYGMEF